MKNEINTTDFEGDSEITLVHDNDSVCVNQRQVIKHSFSEGQENGRLLLKEIRALENQLDREIRELAKKEVTLTRAVKVLQTYETELGTVELINKWRSVCQCGMSYLMNAILVKIDRMGGYEEFKRKEIEAKKRQVEYQYDDGIQQQMDEILDSPDFFHLPVEEKNEIREMMDEKAKEAEDMKQKQLEKYEKELKENGSNEMTLQELASKLKVDYDMLYLQN
ncbi:unnamed protein product [Kluyveromyces dobzhanskii CBS 2104]|uniref:WGS project CCBQ000000000 data, contig 00272 n=1 Tax=Kluyveromyces dobzhanskii CBS 2104 TaxID=1427455 RepID=A0A0A8LAT0_9SACH|nr:unnamed protein product [Kluyveromyces dobzhanskii CBS 2104]